MDEKKAFSVMSERIEYSLSVPQTTCIKGIFVVLIFLSHSCQYIDTKTLPFFRLYLLLGSILGQLIVAPFLFYSGYGVMEQIKDKGESYVDQMPKKEYLRHGFILH